MRKKLPYLLPSFVFFLGAPLVWMLCFREVPLRVSPETTYITQPRTNDGKSIDWFRAIKERFEPRCKPEENGFRMIAAALGKAPYFEEPGWYWPELCKALDLDPNLTPTRKLEAPKDFFNREFLLWLEQNETPGPMPEIGAGPNEPTDTEKLDRKLKSEPWTAEEFPFLVRWIEENSPLLDLAAEALKKELFFVPKVRGTEFEGTNEMLYSLYGEAMIPWNLTEAFLYRMNFRLGKNDLDGAWSDAVSLTRLRMHRKPYGLIETNHFTAPLDTVLRNRTLTEAQGIQFKADLDPLPKPTSTEDCLEFWRITCLRNLEVYRQMPETFFGRNPLQTRPSVNWNVIAREINRYVDLCETAAKEIDREPDPVKKKKIVDDLNVRLMTPPKRSQLGQWLGKPITVAGRSKEFAWADQQAYFRFRFSLLLGEPEKELDALRKRLENGE